MTLGRVVTGVSKDPSAFICRTKPHVSVCMFSYLKGRLISSYDYGRKTKFPLFLYLLAKNVCSPFRGQENDKPALLRLY